MTLPGGSGDAPSETARHATIHAAIHASCLLLGEDGVLIRGPAGAAKSSLCLELLDHADALGRHARLVGDDRICLSRRHGRIVARPHPALEGLIEIRGLGIRRLAQSAGAAVVRLVADLVEERPRMPEEEPEDATLLSVSLPRLVLARAQPRAYLIRQALAAMRQTRQGRSGENVASRTHFAAKGTADAADP